MFLKLAPLGFWIIECGRYHPDIVGDCHFRGSSGDPRGTDSRSNFGWGTTVRMISSGYGQTSPWISEIRNPHKLYIFTVTVHRSRLKARCSSVEKPSIAQSDMCSLSAL